MLLTTKDCPQNITTEEQNKVWNNELSIIQKQQEHDLNEPELTWWHKPGNQNEVDYYNSLAIAKGYDN